MLHFPVEITSICWLVMFKSTAAGLSWSWPRASCLGPAHDHLKPAYNQLRTSLNQLKPVAMLQNIPNQHMVRVKSCETDISYWFAVHMTLCSLRYIWVLSVIFYRKWMNKCNVCNIKQHNRLCRARIITGSRWHRKLQIAVPALTLKIRWIV